MPFTKGQIRRRAFFAPRPLCLLTTDGVGENFGAISSWKEGLRALFVFSGPCGVPFLTVVNLGHLIAHLPLVDEAHDDTVVWGKSAIRTQGHNVSLSYSRKGVAKHLKSSRTSGLACYSHMLALFGVANSFHPY